MVRTAMVLGLLFSPFPVLGQQPDLELARVISDGYQKNRELLRTLRCRFTYTTGSAKFYDQAIAGEFKSDRIALCNWFTKGDFEKWETFPSADSAGTRVAEQQEIQFLRNGKTTLVDHPRDRSANLRPPGVPPWTDISTPLNLMIMAHDEGLSPAACIERARKGEFVLKEVSEKLTDGKPSYVLAFLDSKEAHANLITMVMDRSLGFLPMKITITSPRSIIECRILETKQLPNGAWFPMSSRLGLRVNSDSLVSKTHVSSIKVLEVGTTPEPTDEDLSLNLAKGTEVLNTSDGTASFRVKEDRRVLASELLDLTDQTIKIAKYRKLESRADHPAEVNEEPKATDYSYQAILSTSLIVALIFVFCVVAKFFAGWR